VPGPVILISIDTLRADHLPAYGYHASATPAIDSLAREGVVFERAYAHSTQTRPSHATLMTAGCHPRTASATTMGRRLRRASVRWRNCCATRIRDGRIVSSALLGRASGLSRGFDFFDDELPPGDGDLPPALRRRSGAKSEEIAERWLSGLGTTRLFLFLHIDEPAPRAQRRTTRRLPRRTPRSALRPLPESAPAVRQSTILLLSDHARASARTANRSTASSSTTKPFMSR